MAPFKDHLSPSLTAALAGELTAAWPDFPRARFVEEASAGLEQLELKARARQIAEELARALPGELGELERLVERALRRPAFTGWMLWPFCDAVTELTLDSPDSGLPLLRRLTPGWSAEFAIRPFLKRHPEVTFRHLTQWLDDPDEHVRRLISEGTRPRLPWAPRLQALIDDPSPGLLLLERLHDDRSEYVRRSVANHLNDVAKDHPELALATAERWRTAGGEHVGRVIRHGLRGLIKAGHPRALALVGVDADVGVELIELIVQPDSLEIGGQATVACTLLGHGQAAAAVEVDLRIHYLNAAGAATRRKTFKFARATLAAGEPLRLVRTFGFRSVSIRELHPGDHLLELQVNGRIVGATTLRLR